LLNGEFVGKDTILIDAIRDDENKLRRLDFKGVATAPAPEAVAAGDAAKSDAK